MATLIAGREAKDLADANIHAKVLHGIFNSLKGRGFLDEPGKLGDLCLAQVAFPERVDWPHNKLAALMTRRVMVEKPEWYNHIPQEIIHFFVMDAENDKGVTASLINKAGELRVNNGTSSPMLLEQVYNYCMELNGGTEIKNAEDFLRLTYKALENLEKGDEKATAAATKIISTTGIGRSKHYAEEWAEIASTLNYSGGTLLDLGGGPGLNAWYLQQEMQKKGVGFSQVHNFDLGSMDGYKNTRLIDFRPVPGIEFKLTDEVIAEMQQDGVNLHMGHDLRSMSLQTSAPDLHNSPEPHVYVLQDVISHMTPKDKTDVLARISDIVLARISDIPNHKGRKPRSFLIFNCDFMSNQSVLGRHPNGIIILDLNNGVPLLLGDGKSVKDKLEFYKHDHTNGSCDAASLLALQNQLFPTREEIHQSITVERAADQAREDKYTKLLADSSLTKSAYAGIYNNAGITPLQGTELLAAEANKYGRQM